MHISNGDNNFGNASNGAFQRENIDGLLICF